MFTALREIIAAFGGDDPHLGLYGAFGYDLAFQFEPVRRRLDRPADQRDLVLHLPDRDHRDRTASARRRSGTRYEFEVDGRVHGRARPGNGGTGGGRDTQPVRDRDLPAAAECRDATPQVVAEARERFARGDLFEVVPGHVFYAPVRVARPRSTSGCAQRNPAPYEFLFNLGEGEYLVGASPEMYVRVTGDRVETCPISGTIARGGDPLEDAGQHPHPARLGQGGVRADHVHRRGPQRQVAGLRAGHASR